LPTSDYFSLTREGGGSFAETLKKTAQLALLEASAFSENALGLLEGKPLMLNKDTGGDKRFTSKALGDDYGYFSEVLYGGPKLKLFDASLETKSFWAIDHISGELYGILPDQTGGGTTTIMEQLEELDKVV